MNKKYNLILVLLFITSHLFGQQKPEVKDALTRIRYNLSEGDYKTAITNYDLLLKLDTTRASDYLYNKGLCNYYLKKDSASESCFRIGLTKKTVYAGNYLGIGIQLVQSATDSSIYYSKKLIPLLKDNIYPTQRIEKDNSVLRRGLLSSAYQNIGMAYFVKGDSDSALFYLGKAISLNPASDDHLLACSYVHFKLNNFEKAYTHSKRALELNRYESRSALLMVMSLEKINKLEKASIQLNECIAQQNNALSFWKKADGSIKLDLMDNSRIIGYRTMEQVNAEFLVLSAYLHFKRNQKDLAAEAYNKAIKLTPETYFRFANETDFMNYMAEFIAFKLKIPLSPKNYLPLYNNIFSNTIINSR